MKTIKKLFLITFIMIAFILIPKSNANEWNSLNFDVDVMLNGDMIVEETWDIYIDETNTLFKNFNVDTEKYSDITNVRVSRIENGQETFLRQIYEEQYHVDPECYYALYIKNGSKFEIAWNVGLDNSSDTRTYKIYYTVKNAVKVYNDCTELYWQFVGNENEIYGENVTGTINLPYNSLDIDKVRVWAHGPLNGDIQKISNNKVYFTVPGLSTGRMVEIRVVTDEDIYYTDNHIGVNKLDSILKEETGWAEKANRERKRDELITKALAIGILGGNLFFGIFLFKKTIAYVKEGKMIPKMEKYDSDLKYYRDIPDEENATPARCDYLYNFRSDSSYIDMNKVFPAIMLDLATKGYLEFRLLDKNNIEIEVKNKDISGLPSDEKYLFDLILRCCNKNHKDIITSKEFSQYAKKEYDLFHSKANKTKEDAENYHKEQKNIDKEKEELYKKWNKRWSDNFTVFFVLLMFVVVLVFIPALSLTLVNALISLHYRNKIKTVLSPKGYLEKTEWKALKNFLNDYSLIKEKSAPDIVLWEKYLVYATVFGISEKVIKQLKVDYPQFFDGSYSDSLGRYTYFNVLSDTRFSDDAFRSFSRSLSNPFTTASSAYSSAHYSSGSGGGGGFSGGGGGRRRRRWLWRKIKIRRIMMKILLYNGIAFINEKFQKRDILIEDGKIAKIEEVINEKVDREIDLKNKYIFPGLIDVHTHLREPGFEYKETIATGSMSAAKGGFTSICAMPNLNPVPDNLAHLEPELESIEKDAVVHVYPYGSITVEEKGEELSAMDELAEKIVAFSDDGKGIQEESVMKDAMIKAKSLDKLVVAHCEVNSLLKGGYIHDGEYAKLHGHKGICSESEWGEIKRDVAIAKETGAKYHVCHISTKESVEIIRNAKREGTDVTCETCPHYLVLNDLDLKEDGFWKMNPPIRGPEDQLELLKGLKDGTIDMIVTDHAPHSLEEKSKGLEKSLMGIVGLETSFPLIYTHLVKNNVISLEKALELMNTNPRKRFRIGTEIKIGEVADISIFDLNKEYVIDSNKFASKGRNTPFNGMKVFGKCEMTIVSGKIVWEETNV